MKWLYIKNGNVAVQLNRLGSHPIDPPEGGPDAFLGDFLSKDDSPKLMMSWDIVNDDVTKGNVRAITYRVSGSRFRIIGNALLRVLASIKVVYEVLLYRPDRIICGRVGAMLWLSYVLSLLINRPFIHSRHNSLDDYGSIPFWLDKFCIKRAAGVICHGPFLADQSISLGVDSERVFDFDVGYKSFASTLETTNNEHFLNLGNSKLLIYVGRMAANKGVYDLLDVVKRLNDNGIDIAVIYIGEGAEVQAISDLAREYHLSDKVIVKGRVNHEQLSAYICQSYMMITPTRSEFPEGRCMSAMEGLACGVPVLAPNNGPFPYLVKDGVNGMLYQVDNVENMMSKIMSVLSDEEKYALLLKGASQSKKELERPELTFYEAVQKAFN